MRDVCLEIGILVLGLFVVACLSPILHNCVMGTTCVTLTVTGGVVTTLLVLLSLTLSLLFKNNPAPLDSSNYDFPINFPWSTSENKSPSLPLLNQIFLL
jgi:hypothetical protein